MRMQPEPPSSVQPSDVPPRQRAYGVNETTWRFLGDRDAADQAYCIRFGVKQAPEPLVVPGGAWAYALPGVSLEQRDSKAEHERIREPARRQPA